MMTNRPESRRFTSRLRLLLETGNGADDEAEASAIHDFLGTTLRIDRTIDLRGETGTTIRKSETLGFILRATPDVVIMRADSQEEKRLAVKLTDVGINVLLIVPCDSAHEAVARTHAATNGGERLTQAESRRFAEGLLSLETDRLDGTEVDAFIEKRRRPKEDRSKFVLFG
jgi:hypothetical protein